MQQTNFQACQSLKKHTHERTRDAMGITINTPTIATITNEDNISTLLDEKGVDIRENCVVYSHSERGLDLK